MFPRETTEQAVYRYERKFLVDQMDTYQVRALIKSHPQMFEEPYPPRYVNNVYLDTPDMAYYDDNVSGIKDRCKVRIRWYGELFGFVEKPVLEFKIKDGLVGTKKQYLLAPFNLDEVFSPRYLKKKILISQLPEHVRFFLNGMDPVLLNRYYRWYFATKDGRFRVTIDTEMQFYNIHYLKNAFKYQNRDHKNIVVELKYAASDDVLAQRVSSYFPFSLTKNSKYVQGIERVYL